MEMRRIYMDHAATTPLHPEVWDAMIPYFTKVYGNPSSIHHFGREARSALENAREQVAHFLGAQNEEIIFTSGGTESDNMAIRGVALACKNNHRHFITSTIEHHAVLETCHLLEQQGSEVSYLPVNNLGLLDPQEVDEALRPETTLVSIMYANNEIGTVEPIERISKITKKKGVPFHTDAVQACGSIPIDVTNLGVDLLSMSAHKIYGPKGIGVLFIRKGTPFMSILRGGEQEMRHRAGTENLAGAVGMGKACELASYSMKETSKRISKLRDRLIKNVLEQVSGATLTGHPKDRLPGIASFIFDGIESQALLIRLDLEGIAASNGSACASGSPQPSHVLTALGLPEDQVKSSLRFSLGNSNDENDVDHITDRLAQIISDLRRREERKYKVESYD